MINNINTLRPRQNGRQFPDDIFKCIFVNGNIWISIKISLKSVPEVLINNIAALVQIMAWHRPGEKPLSEPMLISLLMHIWVIGPQWVNPLCFRQPNSSQQDLIYEESDDLLMVLQSNLSWHGSTGSEVGINIYIQHYVWNAIINPYPNSTKV